MNKTVVIPCAGTGSRLGDLTKYYNKALCTLGPKPVISYIIEHFTKEDEIIILLGYKGDFVKQVVQAIYPDWNITFRDVDIYEGPLSGLGYSLTKAYDLLQKPFIFWSNDTVVDLDVNKQDYTNNWIALSEEHKGSKDYRHALRLQDNTIYEILPKDPKNISVPLDLTSDTYYSVEENCFPYIGVSYIKDYDTFWDAYHNDPKVFIEIGETAGLNNLEEITATFTERWVDTGNREILEKAQKEYSLKMEEVILPKPNEAIWFVDSRAIKFHVDEKFIRDRVTRAKKLLNSRQKKNGICLPEILSFSRNTYVYSRAAGDICSNIVDSTLLNSLLNQFFQVDIEDISKDEKLEIYRDFYYNKTQKRVEEYCKNTNDCDGVITINGLKCLPAKELLDKIDWSHFSEKGVFTKNYHGDFHLENILYDDENFVLLDWRQNFGKSEVGDVYYDLAKMWHSLIVNHALVKEDLFSVKQLSLRKIKIDIHRTFIDTECEKTLISFIEKNYDVKQTELLTAIVFLNICACHTYPYSKFLFYLGKYLINKFYIENPSYFIFQTNF